MGQKKASLLVRCPHFRGMQEWYLGWEKVSCLERCPQFRGVLIEGFNCTLGYILIRTCNTYATTHFDSIMYVYRT